MGFFYEVAGRPKAVWSGLVQCFDPWYDSCPIVLLFHERAAPFAQGPAPFWVIQQMHDS